MKTVELTEDEANLLLEFLGLDLDKIGFDDVEQEILDTISDKIISA